MPAARSSASRFACALDFVSDWAVLVFASWTLFAYAGMSTQASVSLLVPLWLVTVPLLGAVLVILSRRSGRGSALPAEVETPPPAAPTSPYRQRLLVAAGAAGLASAILAGVSRNAPWELVWLGTCSAVAAAVGFGRLRSERPGGPVPSLRWPAHAFVVLVGLVFATMSLFVRRQNLDDAFYVNRATGVAELNRIPVRDIIFTDEQVAAVSGTGLPVESFSALQGALGRFVGLHGASVAYYVTPPLFTFLATWALWRLLRSWAPRNVVLCFALGCTYWLFSGQKTFTAGSFFLNRMWQGKVIFVAWLVLTTYVFLTRWLSRRDALTAVLLLATALGGLGMTSSASFVAPLVFGAAMVPLVAAREWRGLPVLVAAAPIPLVIALYASQKYPILDVVDLAARSGIFGVRGTTWYFHEVFGLGVIAVLGLIGLWAAPWLARSGPATRLTTGIAVVATILLAPAVLPTLDHMTELSSVLRRTLWVVPLPALVGLFAAVPVAELLGRLDWARALPRRLVVAAPALLVVGLLLAFGQPLWTSVRTGDAIWVRRPAWKVEPRALDEARAILGRYQDSEPILASAPIMYAIAIITVSPKAVNPRSFYARWTPEQPERTQNRMALERFVSGRWPKPSREDVQSALADLRVGLVCLADSKPRLIREVELTGLYAEAFRVRGMTCLERRAAPP
jgi:Family of unknown function (DUF6077)